MIPIDEPPIVNGAFVFSLTPDDEYPHGQPKYEVLSDQVDKVAKFAAVACAILPVSLSIVGDRAQGTRSSSESSIRIAYNSMIIHSKFVRGVQRIPTSFFKDIWKFSNANSDRIKYPLEALAQGLSNSHENVRFSLIWVALDKLLSPGDGSTAIGFASVACALFPPTERHIKFKKIKQLYRERSKVIHSFTKLGEKYPTTYGDTLELLSRTLRYFMWSLQTGISADVAHENLTRWLFDGTYQDCFIQAYDASAIRWLPSPDNSVN